MDMQCKLMEDVSKKTGNKYFYILIPSIQKKVFLEAVELELLKAKGFIK